tara:strand:- start:1970 stop:2941 length:972 start_codon:yes stop_codon:yes gene_type:complete
LPKNSTVAVIPFNESFSGSWSDGGWSIAEAEVSNTLTNVTVEGEKYFRVADRELISRILDEQALSRTGNFDASSAPELGALIGADYVVYGTTDYDYSEFWNDETHRVCAGRNEEGCIWAEIPVKCQVVSVGTTFYPRVVDVQTGEVSYAQRISRSDDADGCRQYGFDARRSRRGYAKMNSSAVAKDLLRSSIEEFRTHIAPYYGLVALQFALKHELANESAGQQFSFAKELHASNLVAACDIWVDLDKTLTAAQRGPDTATRLNHGTCLEFKGQLEAAEALYASYQSELISSGLVPPGSLNVALRRVRKRISDQTNAAAELGS